MVHNLFFKHILYVLSSLSFKRSFRHVCLRVETKELLFEASRVGTDDEELIFPVKLNYLSILFSMLYPDLLIQVILNEIEQWKNCINLKILQRFYNSGMKKWKSRFIRLIKS